VQYQGGVGVQGLGFKVQTCATSGRGVYQLLINIIIMRMFGSPPEESVGCKENKDTCFKLVSQRYVHGVGGGKIQRYVTCGGGYMHVV
jgi:hypothetical protein